MSKMPNGDQPKMPTRLREFMKGKKTYATALAIIVVGILNWQGVEVPPFVWAALSALGLGFLRAGVKNA
jgi:hypothetical protein